MKTLEQIREQIRRNFPSDTAQSSHPRQLTWNRETATTIVSSCGTYRISRKEDPGNKGLWGYALELSQTPTAKARHLCGPMVLAKDCREAAQRHLEGLPLQADLA
jgi:hypothetical protein